RRAARSRAVSQTPATCCREPRARLRRTCQRGRGERDDEPGDEALQRGVSRLAVVGVQLCDRERREPLGGYEHAESLECSAERQPDVATRVLREWCVREVD